MKKLLALLFTVNILFATTSQNEVFLKKIKTLNNLEHNVSQKTLKEKMEHWSRGKECCLNKHS